MTWPLAASVLRVVAIAASVESNFVSTTAALATLELDAATVAAASAADS